MGKGLDRLKELAAGQTSPWHEEAEWYRLNSAWLKRSSKIAFRILTELREKGLTQKDLALKMEVSPQYISKIVKGQENLSLETVSKIEEALDICLISINKYTNYTYTDTTPMSTTSGQIPLSEKRSSWSNDDYTVFPQSSENKDDAA